MFPERCVYFVASSPVLEPTSVACAETNSSTLEALTVDKFLAPFWSPQLWHVQGKRSKVSIAMFPERLLCNLAGFDMGDPLFNL